MSQMEGCQAEYTGIVKNMDLVLELLDDCGNMYRQADDFQRRCFNQAIFERILVHDDLTLDVEYAEPFDTLLNAKVFTLKSRFEAFIQNECGGDSRKVTHRTLAEFIDHVKTQTGSNLPVFLLPV